MSRTAIYSEGFPGLLAEPALDSTVEPVDGMGGFDNVAPRLAVEVGPGGQVWDPSPSYRTRYMQAEYPAGSNQLQGNNWFTSIPYLLGAPVGQDPCKVRFDAHTFRVYTTTDGVTWTGQYANKYSKIVKSGLDFLLYDSDGKLFLFPQTNGYRCSAIAWIG
ncbi:MAG: hypothetical protein HY721_05920, partial [Planctomycetes bacterium]|nr:hypothetical protein [Planctomycetota bacterium]